MESSLVHGLDPRFKYCAGDFKQIVNFGAARPRGHRHCTDCRYRRTVGGKESCLHPRLPQAFSLGTHPDRMGCAAQKPATKKGAAR